MLYIHRALILLGELQQMLAGFGKASDDEGETLFAGSDVDSAAHAHDGVERCADGACQGAVTLNDFGVVQTASTSQELES